MNGYATAGWESFFVAEVGGAAALTGLIFVAVSINLTKILAYVQLPRRAAEALVMLTSVLAIASLALVPGQSRVLLGLEITAVALLAWIYPIVLQRRDARLPENKLDWVVKRALTHQIATLPLLVAGLSVLAGAGGGLYWLVPGTLLSFAGALFNAWVLLVEILR